MAQTQASQQKPEAAPQKNRALSMVFTSLAAILTMTSISLPIPILPLYAGQLGASLAIIGFITGAYGIIQVILKIPLGFYSDRTGRRKLFVAAGLLIGTIGGIGLIYSTDPTMLLISRTLQGFGGSVIALYTVIFSSFFPAHKRPTASALAMGSIGFGTVLGPLLTGFLVASMGIKGIFTLSTIACAAGAVCALLISEQRVKVETVISLKRTVEIFKIPLVYLASIGVFLLTIGYFGQTISFLPVYATMLGFDKGTIGFMIAVAGAAYALFNLLAGPLTEKVGHKKILLIGGAILGLAVIALPFLRGLMEIYAYCFLVGMGYGLAFPPAIALVMASVFPKEFATSTGIYFTIYSLGIVLGPVIVGNVAGFVGLSTSFMIAGVLALLSLILFARIKLG